MFNSVSIIFLNKTYHFIYIFSKYTKYKNYVPIFLFIKFNLIYISNKADFNIHCYAFSPFFVPNIYLFFTKHTDNQIFTINQVTKTINTVSTIFTQ